MRDLRIVALMSLFVGGCATTPTVPPPPAGAVREAPSRAGEAFGGSVPGWAAWLSGNARLAVVYRFTTDHNGKIVSNAGCIVEATKAGTLQTGPWRLRCAR